MKIVMRCYGQDPGGYGDPYTGDCDYAVLEVTPQLLEKIRRRAKLIRGLYQRNNEIWSVTWWDYTITYYSWDFYAALENADADLDSLDDKGFLELPEGFDLESIAPQRTGAELMEMLFHPGNPLEVRWTACPKHTNITVTTVDLTLEMLEELCPAE